MPELPEVETVTRELNKKLKSQTVESVEVRFAKILGVGPTGLGNKRQEVKGVAEEFARLLRGRRVLGVKRRAKLLIFECTGELHMLVHLKMTGQFIYEDAQLRKKTLGKYRLLNKANAPLVELPSKHTHVIFNFAGGGKLYYNDMRKFGYLKLVRKGQLSDVAELQEYGPEPLTKVFGLKHLLSKVRAHSRVSVKQFLMDNKVVVGIGNIYSDEILFHAGVRPGRPVSSIKNQELSKIYEAIRPVLEKGIKTKGSSVGDFIRTDGTQGRMGKFHYVYGRKGQECKLCGTIIKSIKLGGRTGSFCPRCQA